MLSKNYFNAFFLSIISGQLDKTGRFKAARMTVKLDGDIIMGEIAATADKRYLNPAYGSLEDMGWDYDHLLDMPEDNHVDNH